MFSSSLQSSAVSGHVTSRLCRNCAIQARCEISAFPHPANDLGNIRYGKLGFRDFAFRENARKKSTPARRHVKTRAAAALVVVPGRSCFREISAITSPATAPADSMPQVRFTVVQRGRHAIITASAPQGRHTPRSAEIFFVQWRPDHCAERWSRYFPRALRQSILPGSISTATTRRPASTKCWASGRPT